MDTQRSILTALLEEIQQEQYKEQPGYRLFVKRGCCSEIMSSKEPMIILLVL